MPGRLKKYLDDEGIKMSYADFDWLVQPRVLSFST